jgi:hypothetical protein
LYQAIADDYSEKAAALAESTLKAGALCLVMKQYMSGNPSGFDSSIFVPAMTPGGALSGEPFVDGRSPAFRDGSEAMRAQIIDQLKAAGFHHKFSS